MNFKTSVSIQDNKFVSKIKAWFWAIRPFSISAAVVPVLVGSAFAFYGGKFSLFRFLLVLIAGILVQMATNLIDEYSDHARPEGEHKIPAPYKVIALGKLTAKEVKLGAFVCFGVATVIGIYLIYLCGLPILFMSLGAAAAAYFYSAGPLPLGKIGLGQPLVEVRQHAVEVGQIAVGIACDLGLRGDGVTARGQRGRARPGTSGRVTVGFLDALRAERSALPHDRDVARAALRLRGRFRTHQQPAVPGKTARRTERGFPGAERGARTRTDEEV